MYPVFSCPFRDELMNWLHTNDRIPLGDTYVLYGHDLYPLSLFLVQNAVKEWRDDEGDPKVFETNGENPDFDGPDGKPTKQWPLLSADEQRRVQEGTLKVWQPAVPVETAEELIKRVMARDNVMHPENVHRWNFDGLKDQGSQWIRLLITLVEEARKTVLPF